MRLIACTTALAAVTVLSLSACGGGGSDNEPVTSQPPPTAETVASARAAAASQLHEITGRVASSLPQFGSVVQSAGVDIARVSGVSTTFSGNLSLTVSRAGGGSTTLNTVQHTLDSSPLSSVVEGHSSRSWGVARVTNDGLSAARILVSWDNEDMSDYLAGGYWMHLAGDTQALRYTGVEVGAFVDGPELSLADPPTMPTLGSASYQGPAAGIYAIEYGTDAALLTGYARGSIEGGEFASIIDLSADFGAGTISGCVGCTGGVYFTGVVADAVSGETASFANVHSPTRVRLGATSIDANGTFRSRSVTLETSQTTVATSSGAWGGQFSNIPDSEGDPRLVAGTFGGQGLSTGGSQAAYVGAFGAAK